MSVIDTLIYDRTQADVDRVFELKSKILSGGVSSLTAEEKSEYMSGMKGAYNAADLNRVGGAVAYIADRLTSLPDELLAYLDEKGVADDTLFRVPYDRSTIVVTAKQDWTMADVPTQSQVSAFLTDLGTLRRQLTLPSDAPVVPTTLDNLTYTVANEIEYLLWMVNAALIELENDLYEKIDRAAESFVYADEVSCGE
jgi:hypothetical protein